MDLLLRPFRALFGIYAILVFLCTLILFAIITVFIFLLFPAKKAPHIAHAANRGWAMVLQVMLLTPFRFSGQELIDPKRTYVFIANHQSQLDIPLFARACRNTFRFLAKAELTKIPLMGFVIRKTYITVNRTDRRDRNRSIEVMKKSLDEGISVFICPEGTRNREKEPAVMEFRDGAFRLAVLTGTPIAVLTVFDSGDRLSPKRPLELSPGVIRGSWSKPIETTGLTLDDVPALKEKVRAIMTEQLLAYRSR